MHDDNTPLSDDLIWGGKGISIEIFGNDAPKYVRKTFYLLERGLIDAEKIGDQWVGSRQRLRSRFHGGQVAGGTILELTLVPTVTGPEQGLRNAASRSVR